MKIKICGLFREEDIDYVNEARPDYCGFVFAPSRRQVSPALAARLRRRLAEGITPVGVFIDAPAADVAALYRDGVISIAQLHGGESEEYIARLKEESGDTPIPVIKVIKYSSNLSTEYMEEKSQRMTRMNTNYNCLCHSRNSLTHSIDYYLLDSGSGSGETFDWGVLNSFEIDKPWFLAGGIGMDNIEKAISIKPFAVDVSSGAETDGVKDREKILRLTEIVRKGNKE